MGRRVKVPPTKEEVLKKVLVEQFISDFNPVGLEDYWIGSCLREIGLAGWIKSFPGLKLLWIITSDFFPNDNVAIAEALRTVLVMGTKLVFFSLEEETQPGARIWLYKNSLLRPLAPKIREFVREMIKEVPVAPEQYMFCQQAFVFANPSEGKEAGGQQQISLSSELILSLSLKGVDLRRCLDTVTVYAGKKLGDNFENIVF